MSAFQQHHMRGIARLAGEFDHVVETVYLTHGLIPVILAFMVEVFGVALSASVGCHALTPTLSGVYGPCLRTPVSPVHPMSVDVRRVSYAA